MNVLNSLESCISVVSGYWNMSSSCYTVSIICASIVSLNRDFSSRFVDSHEWFWFQNLISDWVLADALIQTWSGQNLLCSWNGIPRVFLAIFKWNFTDLARTDDDFEINMLFNIWVLIHADGKLHIVDADFRVISWKSWQGSFLKA